MTSQRHCVRQLVFHAIFALFLYPAESAAAKHTVVTLGVVPQQQSTLVRQAWLPLLKQLSLVTGATIKLKTYASVPDFESDLLIGGPDLVYLSPYHQLIASEAQGYIPMVRDGSEQLVGVIVVAADSDLQDVQDLDGTHLAFPSPTSFGASLYLRAQLRVREGISIIPHYVGSHGNVYRCVVHGDIPAGGGTNKTLDRESTELNSLLRVIYETPGLPAHPISAHPRVPSRLRHTIQSALLRFGKTDSGRVLLNQVGMQQPVEANHDRDYAHLAELGLTETPRGSNTVENSLSPHLPANPGWELQP